MLGNRGRLDRRGWRDAGHFEREAAGETPGAVPGSSIFPSRLREGQAKEGLFRGAANAGGVGWINRDAGEHAVGHVFRYVAMEEPLAGM